MEVSFNSLGDRGVDRFGEVPAGRCNTDCLITIGLHRMVLKPKIGDMDAQVTRLPPVTWSS